MTLKKAVLTVLALAVFGVPAFVSLVAGLAALPREGCTLDDQAAGYMCSDYGELYWFAFGVFTLAVVISFFLILRKRSAD